MPSGRDPAHFYNQMQGLHCKPPLQVHPKIPDTRTTLVAHQLPYAVAHLLAGESKSHYVASCSFKRFSTNYPAKRARKTNFRSVWSEKEEFQYNTMRCKRYRKMFTVNVKWQKPKIDCKCGKDVGTDSKSIVNVGWFRIIETAFFEIFLVSPHLQRLTINSW